MSNTFIHFELNTDDVAKAKKFYSKIFDWTYEEMPAMQYTMLKAGTTTGGLTKKPMPQAPTQWLCYIEVESVKATIAKAKKAGAQIMLPYQSLGTMGAIGIFVDPTGAGLGVWEKGAPAPVKKAAPKRAAAKGSAPAKKASAPAKKASAPAKKASAAKR